MSSPNLDPQIQLRDFEARLARFEQWAGITSGCALVLTLSACGVLLGQM